MFLDLVLGQTSKQSTDNRVRLKFPHVYHKHVARRIIHAIELFRFLDDLINHITRHPRNGVWCSRSLLLIFASISAIGFNEMKLVGSGSITV